MNKKRILSICIATYNRSEQLLTLVSNILKNKSQDFLVEITDNASTDDTVERLEQIKDERIIIHKNKINIGGASNIVKSIFNAQSKYALYCNDRDRLDSKKITDLVNILKKWEFSYIQLSEKNSNEKNIKITIFDKGENSLLNQAYTIHPTGIVYNCDLIRLNRFEIKDYIEWAGAEKYLRIAWDLICCGKSAQIDIGIWECPPHKFYMENISRYITEHNKNPEKLYFHPCERIRNMELIMKYLLQDSKYTYEITDDEKNALAINIATVFYGNIKYYKINASSVYEMAHYQVKRKWISTYELIYFYRLFNNAVILNMRKNKVGETTITKWEKRYGYNLLRLMKNSLFYDLIFIKRIIFRQKW